jgi:hypothetical protein
MPLPAVPRTRLATLLTLVLLGAVAPVSARGATLPGFLSRPTDQLAVPGLLAGAEVTPEGDVYTGWAEYELRFGRRLRQWNQPTRTLPDAGIPLLSSVLWDGPVRYTLSLFAVAVAGRPVAYETLRALNTGGGERVAQVAMAVAYTRGTATRGAHGLATRAYRYERPVSSQASGYYTQPGQAFSPAFHYTVSGRDLDRSGLLLARGPAAPARPLATPAQPSMTSAKPIGTTRRPPAHPAPGSPTTPHDSLLYRARLGAGASASFTWQIPLEPPARGAAADRALDALPLPRARAALRRTWAAQEAGAMRIALPEAKVVNTYRAALVELLESRYRSAAGWVQASNKLQYQAFWIRDGALSAEALDLAGLRLAARQDLAFMDTFQQADGLFVSRAGQYDAWGQALWALARHAELTRDPIYAAAQLARIGRAVGWLAGASAGDPLGLLPTGEPHDNELASGHITGDDLWAAGGLRAAVSVAELAGRADLAATWRALDERFEGALDRALAAAVARAGHIPPVLDAEGGQDWGNYYAAYPTPVLDPRSPEVAATLAWARAHMAEGLPTYANGQSLHDYLGFAIFQTELAAGDPRDALAGLYAELAHTTSTEEGWEWDVAPFGSRSSPENLAPHGTFAADYVALLRDLLVSEGAGGELDLLAGASAAWLGPGQRIAVRDAPTARGTLSFTERSTKRGETLSWHGSLAPGTRLVWQLPPWARGVRVVPEPGSRGVSGGELVLHDDAGSATVVFSGRRPHQSYATEVAALNAAYRAHGLRAPLVPARR